MKTKLFKLTICFLILFSGIIIGILLGQNKTAWALKKKQSITSSIKLHDTKKVEWSKYFEVVEIKSKLDNNIQKAYFFKSRSDRPRPLIVSLHTWSGNYNQIDQLAELCESKDLNYIHPDFRGANRKRMYDIKELISMLLKINYIKVFINTKK